jgi:tagatose-1,6-bisphosphate aldolase
MNTLVPGGRERTIAITTEDILRAIEETVPLAAIARDQIEALKHWVAEAGARTASKDVQLVEELKKYTMQRGIGPLEVD